MAIHEAGVCGCSRWCLGPCLTWSHGGLGIYGLLDWSYLHLLERQLGLCGNLLLLELHLQENLLLVDLLLLEKLNLLLVRVLARRVEHEIVGLSHDYRHAWLLQTYLVICGLCGPIGCVASQTLSCVAVASVSSGTVLALGCGHVYIDLQWLVSVPVLSTVETSLLGVVII